MFKSKPCSENLCTNPLFAGGFCKAHQHLREDKEVKRLMKTSPLAKRSIQAIEKSKDRIEELHKQWRFFIKIWNDKEHKSEVSGTPLYGEPLTIYFHHILPKSRYKNAKFDPDNIILLTWQEHNEVENNPSIFKEVNDRRSGLLLKYKSPN